MIVCDIDGFERIYTLPMRRFFEKVDMSDGCWIWTGSITGSGYGQFVTKINKARIVFAAHRIAYHFFNGPVPDWHLVCHRCDNRACVNPAHLFAGSDSENKWDAREKGRLHSPTKLTEGQVIEALEMLRDGRKCQEIGRRLGVSRGCIQSIIRGRSWVQTVRAFNSAHHNESNDEGDGHE